MSHHNVFLVYLLTLLIFLAIDSFWLSLVSPKLYKRYLKPILAEKPNFWAAAIFYLIFIIGLLYFVVYPNKTDSYSHIILSSAMYGLMTYATFDLTNQAILKKWSYIISLIDIIWGIIIATVTTLIITRIFFK